MKKDFDWNLIPCGIAYCRIETEESGRQRYILEECNDSFLACAAKEKMRAELYGSSFLELIAHGDTERFLHYIQEILEAKGEICTIECNMITADGELCDACWRGRFLAEDGFTGILFSVLNFDSYKKERTMLLDAVHAGQAEANRMQRFMMSLPMGVAVFREDKGFEIRAGNTEFFRLTGYSKAEMIESQMDLFDCIYPVDREKMREAIEACRNKDISDEVQLRMQERNGTIHWVILQCSLYQYIENKAFFSVTCWDITDRKQLEDELNLLGEQYRLLQELADEVPMEFDVESRQYRIPFKFADSPEDCAMQYISQERALSHMHEDDREAYLAAYEEASKYERHGSVDFRIHNSRCETEETYIWYRTIYRSIMGPDNKVSHIVGKTYDITADKEQIEQMSEEIRLDPLTRVFNKVETQRLVDGFLSTPTAGTHVLFVIDVDNFKRINDTFGHTVGDTIISDMSHKIRESFRNTDIVGRIGGDEFVVFMKGTTENFARKKAEQLCKVAKKVIYGGDEKLQITISVGIAVFGKDGNTYAELFDKADKAMYRVKKEAKNGYAFVDKNTEEVSDERSMPNAIVTSGEKVDKEILNLAFNLLSHAKDLDISLNLLLEQLAKHFNLNMVSVFIFDEKKAQMTLTNYWSNLGKIYEKEIVPRTWKFFEKEPIGVFINIADTYNTVGSAELFSLENWNKDREPIRNMGAVKFQLPNGVIGELNVGTIRADVTWGEREIETICEVSRVVSVFVSLQTRLWEDRQIIHQLKHRERLTGLYDKNTFEHKVDKIISEKEGGYYYAVSVLDINNFAYVNENFGTNIGDQILCDLADLLEHSSVYSQFACRMYSDYFAVFLKAESKEDIIDVVINGTKAFEEKLNEKYPMGSLNLSVGLCFVEGNESCEIIMENANIARKYAKEHKIVSGIVFAEYMREKRDEVIEVTSHFYDALRNEEFEIYLQPKFLLGSWKVYGAEALARWHRPDGMIIKPDNFVPALEMSGYIVDLDFYMFEKLLAVMKDWIDRGKKLLTISTNFSRCHFENGGGDFVKRIQKLIDYYRVPTEFIEIEITESMVIDNMDALHSCMEELRKMGFRIAIDDFGTGYSSLNVLLEIPANVIKMDKAFTDKLSEERQRRFVSKMGLLIKAARQEVLFEGIETEEQLKYLKASGFKYGQGFLFDKPVTVKAFEQKYL